MSNTRKEDTAPATKADIALVLEKLGENQKQLTLLQNTFTEHEKVVHAQFETILDHIDGVVEQVCEHFDKRFKKLDDACLERFVKQEKMLRALDRRVCVVERRVGVPS